MLACIVNKIFGNKYQSDFNQGIIVAKIEMHLKTSSVKYYIYTLLDGIPYVAKDILPSNTLDFTCYFPGSS